MEFKNVFIINCNEGVIPHINSLPENLEEERRLFYVAITRAIYNINIYTTKSLKGKGKEVSRFIKECEIKFGEVANVEKGFKNLYKIGESITHKTYGNGKVSEINGKYISIIFKGDIERKFDASVLMNSGLVLKS